MDPGMAHFWRRSMAVMATLTPYPYQDEAIRKIVARWARGTSVLCRGSVGTGKTLIALEALARHNRWPALVVVPLAVLAQWRDEARQLGWRRHEVHLYHGTFRTLATYRRWKVVVTTPDTLRRELEAGGPLAAPAWATVVIDEVHTLRRGVAVEEGGETLVYANKTYLAIERAVLKVHRPRLLLLTATPFINSWTDMLALGRWLNNGPTPGTLQSWRAGGSARAMMARHCVDVNTPPAPATRVVVVPHTLTQEERLCHNRCHREVVRRLFRYLHLPGRRRPGHKRRALHAFLAQLTALRRGAVHPRFFAGERARRRSSKFVAALRLLESPALRRRKVVVFCAFLRPLRLLRRFLRGRLPGRRCRMHVGGRAAANRRALDAFSRSRTPDILLATRRSMGVGVNIPCANDVIMLDRDFSQPLEEQAIGRVRRPHRQAEQRWTAYYVTPSDDECMRWMAALQRGKRHAGGALLGAAAAAAAAARDEDLEPRLASARPPPRGAAEAPGWCATTPRATCGCAMRAPRCSAGRPPRGRP